MEDHFGDIIKKARFGWGLTIGDVVRCTQVTPARLTQLEIGQMSPSRREVHLLAQLYKLEEESLWEIATDIWRPKPFDEVAVGNKRLHRYVFANLNANGYILENETGALLIDPGGSSPEMKQLCSMAKKPLEGCLITHAHQDHYRGLFYLLQIKPEITVVNHIQANNRHIPNHIAITIDETLELASQRVEVLVSPGHSSDGLSYKIGNLLFTGDTIFAGSLGRATPGHYTTLLKSAKRLLSLPKQTIILPGHGPATTVAEECIHNPFISEYVWEISDK